MQCCIHISKLIYEISSINKEHLPKCVTNFVEEKTVSKTKTFINAEKISSIAEDLINKTDYANN